MALETEAVVQRHWKQTQWRMAATETEAAAVKT
jgi:hypothetical protein